jgi:hypothetical protein
MNLLTLCLICFGASLVIFVIALIMGQQRMRQIEAVMRQLAEKYGASFTPGNIIYNPYLTFRDVEPQDTASLRVELRLYAALGGRSDPSHTELRAVLPENFHVFSPPYKVEPEGGRGESETAHLRLRPHSFLTRLTITLGAKPYLTGEKAFDDAFDLRGTPDILLRRTFTPPVRRSLLAIKVDRPALHLGRKRSLLPSRPPTGEPFRLQWAPPELHYYFYTAGLPSELAEWEPRIAVGRLLLDNMLNRPAPEA